MKTEGGLFRKRRGTECVEGNGVSDLKFITDMHKNDNNSSFSRSNNIFAVLLFCYMKIRQLGTDRVSKAPLPGTRSAGNLIVGSCPSQVRNQLLLFTNHPVKNYFAILVQMDQNRSFIKFNYRRQRTNPDAPFLLESPFT